MLNKLFIAIFIVITAVIGETTTSSTTASSSESPTLVWVTGTDASGRLATTQSAYTQQFSQLYSSIASPSSGSIGLGTIQGTVGVVRTYETMTVAS